MFGKLQVKHGTVLVVGDQPASIGALLMAVARDMGCPVAYLPGLTMRRSPTLYPGEAKTDARDAFVIADTARVMPHTGLSSCPRSRLWPTRSPGPTTTRRSARESTTPKPSSASRGAEPTCSSRCSADVTSYAPQPAPSA